MRIFRKQEHVENCMKAEYQGDNLFSDVFLYNNSIPEVDFDKIDCSIEFLGKRISYPLMINAMTGGYEFSKKINSDFAKLSLEYNIPMALGSQTIAIEDNSQITSFTIARKENPNGIIIGNMSANSDLDYVKKAVDMLEANAMQLHLNAVQELIMDEGDRQFKGILKNIEKIVKHIEVPIIVKEVGFGMSKDTIKTLYDIGVKYVDISGHGGTNFIEIEDIRNPKLDASELYGWGIPTALALYEANDLKYEDLFLIASGGIKDALQMAKSIAMGANMVAVSGELLKYLIHGEYNYAAEYLEGLLYKFKIVMAITACSTIEELSKLDYKITGRLKDLIY
ncbi:MAG: type 2 isopentenyl-diphosphate Delta-isomerase [Tissierellia bacterium]|nr:type 2 isopentenyl-diphosphate Delta-isomerase [Tissierellia bacterium]